MLLASSLVPLVPGVISILTIDTLAPTVTLARADAQTGTVNSAFDVVVTFSEEVHGLSAGSVVAGGGATVESFSGAGAVYTVTIAPSQNNAGTTLAISMGGAAVMDNAGNEE